MSSPPVRQPCLSFSDGGIYKPLLLHMLEKKGRLGLLQVMSPVQAVFNDQQPGSGGGGRGLDGDRSWKRPIRAWRGRPVPAHRLGLPRTRGRHGLLLLKGHRGGLRRCIPRWRVLPARLGPRPLRGPPLPPGAGRGMPGVDATYQQTVWACPEPEGMNCYYFGDAAAAYAGAYPAGASSQVGWGPGTFVGCPYRRAQVAELPDTHTDTDTEEEAEQDPAAPAAEYEAPCGIEHLDVCYPSDCMHLGWPALVTHLYAAFGFPFHRFCCPALCLKQRHPWPRAVECESSQAKDLATPLSCWCLVPYHCLAVPSPGGSWPSCTPVHSWLPRVNPHGAADPCGGR
nr:uncharacterized protein LOC103350904 isoform X4 [Oryctolagus cuniculus]